MESVSLLSCQFLDLYHVVAPKAGLDCSVLSSPMLLALARVSGLTEVKPELDYLPQYCRMWYSAMTKW